ncbi:MAG TPA: phytanoyl-CoA dioxygenase family protein, partial [Vicinamibacterales bacterium]|nr:phytanoyl-CoA dioxygenase family protein [Vicinamibacterales bacterium]
MAFAPALDREDMMKPTGDDETKTLTPTPPATPAPAPVTYLQKRLDYLKARYLIDPLRVVVHRTRRKFSYINRVMDQAYLATNPGTAKLNRILDEGARLELAGAVGRIAKLAPAAAANQSPDDAIEQAFVFDAVMSAAARFANPRIVFVGRQGGAAAAALAGLGYQMQHIETSSTDPESEVLGRLAALDKTGYDVVVCPSILDRVGDDERLLRLVSTLLAPAGVAIFTCAFQADYQPGAPLPDGRRRRYTKHDLLERLVRCADDCDLIDGPAWDTRLPGVDIATVTLRRGQGFAFDVRFDELTLDEQARFFEDNGFLLVPGALTPKGVEEALADVRSCGFTGTTEDVWGAPSARALVTNTKIVAALRATFGPDIRFVKAAYVATAPEELITPERQRRYLHVDYGIGETWGDFRNSTPAWVNIGIYLTGLTAEHAPLWVVPGSHRKMNIPPNSSMEHLAHTARRVFANPGDAVIFHCRCVHSASFNRSSKTRHAYFYQYRPAWAKPVGPVPEWPEAFVQSFPEDVRPMLL